MIAALCLNPCVDKTVTVEAFCYGGMNRVKAAREDGSGKGVNVALALDQIGEEAVCVGTMGVGNGQVVLQRFAGTGCLGDWVKMDVPVRVNMKVLDASTGRITEINEPGSPLAPETLEEVMAKTLDWARKSTYMVLTGSTPPGCPLDIYETLTHRIREAAPECRVLLDAEGERLRLGLRAKPYMIKPNQYELELLCGRKMDSLEAIDGAARDLLDQGIAVVAVSMGGDGAYLAEKDGAWFAPPMQVPVRSTVGAGDSMVAGMLHALQLGLTGADVLRHGVAAASSSVTTEGTKLIDAGLYRRLLERVELRPVG